MPKFVYALALMAALLPAAPSAAQMLTCGTYNESGGMGLTVTRRCKANPEAGIAEDDAYYAVEARVTPESGFGDSSTFDKSSPSGKALRGFLKTFFNSEKSTNLDIGLTIAQGTTVYPIMSLMNFQLTDDNHWRSSVRINNRTMLHKLTSGNPFNIQLNYAYSRTNRIDLTPAMNIADSLGVKLANPAIAPVLNTARHVINETMKASGVDMQSGYNFNLSPWMDEVAEVEFLLADPAGTKFARVNIRMLGTRSLMASARDLTDIKSALPAGNVTIPLVNLPKELIMGQARDWPLLNAALGPSPSLSDVLGKELTKDSLVTFCDAISAGISTSYMLTSFDSVLVRARLVEAATTGIRAKINPYQRCFKDKANRDVIAARLGIDTEFNEFVEDTKPKPVPYESLAALGCVLKGAAGDDCGPIDITRANLLSLLAPAVEIKALDTLSSTFSAGLPEDYKITPSDFLARFGGKFARFRSISAGPQALIVHETADSAGLRLKVFTDSEGRITGVEFRNIG